jgi:hypothetical protein
MDEESTRRLDSHPSSVFEAVGIALSQWEKVENQLALLYGFFRRDLSFELLTNFSELGRTFRARASHVRREGEIFFTNNPCQTFEGQLTQILERATRLSDNRHKIAHGIVEGILTYEPILLPGEYFVPYLVYNLVPPWYAQARLSGNNTPYRYSSSDILLFISDFSQLENEISEFLLSLKNGNVV